MGVATCVLRGSEVCSTRGHSYLVLWTIAGEVLGPQGEYTTSVLLNEHIVEPPPKYFVFILLALSKKALFSVNGTYYRFMAGQSDW